ncbi:hypothetical protein PBI_OMNICRON_72 [Mycobacterium phage Omnicron]|uniref:Uncharacterized protein n=1 Tax=Mycobacterium phage Omnicron TaxID=1541819 RepID=A0A088FQ92_9CAUD|nr:hypothetical protein PBI_OMNICRON_72 [Mycobacterium phage Omnicron]AIM50405.1 hypothetical protein PBI_OMNICRON_72 [Mycobacterium phage Omnicron]
MYQHKGIGAHDMNKQTVRTISETLTSMPFGAGIGSSANTELLAADNDGEVVELLSDYLEKLQARLAIHARHHNQVVRELMQLQSDREAVRRFFGIGLAPSDAQ